MRVIIIWILLVCSLECVCQQQMPLLNAKLLTVSFNYEPTKNTQRKLLVFKRKKSFYNPLNYLGAGLLFVYQNIFSEQIQASCNYEISCSEYTKICIQKHGFIKGILRGFNQLSECAPNAIYEHPSVYVNNNDQIINHFETTSK